MLGLEGCKPLPLLLVVVLLGCGGSLAHTGERDIDSIGLRYLKLCTSLEGVVQVVRVSLDQLTASFVL